MLTGVRRAALRLLHWCFHRGPNPARRASAVLAQCRGQFRSVELARWRVVGASPTRLLPSTLLSGLVYHIVAKLPQGISLVSLAQGPPESFVEIGAETTSFCNALFGRPVSRRSTWRSCSRAVEQAAATEAPAR